MSGQKFACKVVPRDQSSEQIDREIALQDSIRHPHIVQLYNTIKRREATFLFMELCDSDLQTHIKTHGIEGQRLDESEASRVMKHVLRGLSFMQSKCKVMHRDIKLENILVKRTTD